MFKCSFIEAVIWSKAQQIVVEEDVDVVSAKVAIDNSGNIVVVWKESDDSNNGSIKGGVLNVNSKGISFKEEPTLISKTGELATSLTSLDLSMNGSGKAVAVWLGLDNIVQTSTLITSDSPPTWSTPISLSIISASTSAFAPQVAVDDEGNTLVIWLTSSFNNNTVEVVSQIGNEKKWSNRVTISQQQEFIPSAQIAVNGGIGAAVWVKDPIIEGAIAQISSENSFNWNKPVGLSNPSGVSLDPQVAISSSGRAVAIWRFVDVFSNYSYSIQCINNSESKREEWDLADDAVETLTNVTPEDSQYEGFQYVAAAKGKSNLAFAYWSNGKDGQFSESISQETPWTLVGEFDANTFFLDATIFEEIPQVIWLQGYLLANSSILVGYPDLQTTPPTLKVSKLSSDNADVISTQIPMIASNNDEKGIIVAIWLENIVLKDESVQILMAATGSNGFETSKMLMYWGVDEPFQSDLP